MKCWLFLVVCARLFSVPSASECPSVCACVDHDIDCRSRSLIQVPTENISPHTTSWDLSHNNLTSLRHDVFHHSAHTMALDLSRNQIVNISETAFSHLENVMSINLSYNNITRIGFTHVRSDRLYALYLSHNPHLSLPEPGFELRHLKVLEMKHCGLSRLPVHFFEHMTRLEVVELGRNRLSSLESKTFAHLKHLVFLDLSGNRFVNLPSGILHQLDLSVHVKLVDNPFVCECKTHHAYTRYLAHRGNAPLHCSHFDARSEATEPLSHSHFPDFYREHCSSSGTSPGPPAREGDTVPAGASPGNHRGAVVAATLAAILVVAVVVTLAVRRPWRRHLRLGDTNPQRFSILKGSDEV